MSKKKKEFNISSSDFGVRGWIFVIYSILTFLITTAILDSIQNLSLPMLCEQYGWNYTTMISLVSVFGWICIVFMIIFGQTLHKFSPKKGAIILGIVYTVSTVVYPLVTSLWQLIVVFFLICIISTIWPQQFNAIITSNWFPRKKGLVIGWTTIGLPVGSGIGVLLYNSLSAKFGMAHTYYIYAAVSALCVIFCAIFVTDYPEQCGCFPDNDENMTREDANRLLEEGRELARNSIWTNKRLLRTKEVWLIGISCGIMLLFAGGFMSQMIPRLLALGYDQMEAVKMMTIAALLGGLGSYLVGLVDTKIGPKKTIIVVHTIAIIACILNIIPSHFSVMTSLIFIGIVLGGASNTLLSISSTMWGRYAFTNVYGVVLPMNQIVGSCGTIIVAQTAARFSYTGSYIIVAALALVGIFLILPVKEDAMKKIEEAEAKKSQQA